MSIAYEKTPDGLWVDLKGKLGCIQATIHRPRKGEKDRRTWRLCFAGCTGDAYELQGKVRDRNTLEAIKHDLAGYDRTLNGNGTPIPGFRGLPTKEEMAHAAV
jgi:hypothetical protein